MHQGWSHRLVSRLKRVATPIRKGAAMKLTCAILDLAQIYISSVPIMATCVYTLLARLTLTFQRKTSVRCRKYFSLSWLGRLLLRFHAAIEHSMQILR